MRHVATILLSVLAGVHCGAAATTSGEDPSEASAPKREAKPAVDPPSHGASTTDEGEETFLVTSSASGDDGAEYVTGTFSGRIVFGDRALTSRGEDDVFLARIEPDGTVAWAIAVGSKRNERAPNVTFEEGRVKVVALTRGEVDCGAGPMGTWSSAMSFYCAFGASEGEMLFGMTMPTGEP